MIYVICIVTAVLTSVLTAPTATAQWIDFRAAEGFAGGPSMPHSSPSQPNVWCQPGMTINALGSGTISGEAHFYQRFVAFQDQIDLAGLPVGGQITLVVGGYTPQRAIPNQRQQVAGVGMSYGYNDLGKASCDIGLQLLCDPEGNILLDEVGFEIGQAAVDTGFQMGDTFDIQIVINKTDATRFQAVSTVGKAVLITTDSLHIPNATAGLIYQNQGPTKGVFSIDRVGLNPPKTPAAAPEDTFVEPE